MKYQIHLWGPRDRKLLPPHAVKINVTSTSTDFGKTFSPFMNQGPIRLYGLESHNVENLWQSCKAYDCHVGKFKEWCQWRDRILSDTKAHRYPMGKGVKPKFAWMPTLGKLSYIQARKAIYIPAYEQKLQLYCTRELQTLTDMLTVTDVWLFDFDVRITEQSFDELVDDASRPLGHGFVLKNYLENNYGRYCIAAKNTETTTSNTQV